jgi:predicted  nucleic acid-binding Zn-ribbon protein
MADLSTILKPNNTTLNLYCKNAILDGTNVLNELATLQTEIDNISPGNPNVWINGAGETTTNQQILFTDNSQNGAITSDKLYFDKTNNWIILNDEIVPLRSEINFIQDEIINTNHRIDGVDGTLLAQSRRIDDIETTTETQQTEIDNLGVSINSQQTAIDNLGISVNNNTNSINSLGITVNSQGSTINDLGSAVNALNSTTISQQSQINTNTSNISTNTSSINSLNSLTTSQGTQISTNTSDISTINSKLKQNLYNYYVSNISGNDISGNGNLNNPYKTIGAVMTVINTLSADINVIINLSAGNYTENITVIKSSVSIIGANSISTIITGDITYNMTQNSSFYSIGQIANITCIGTITHTNSNIYSNSLSISGIISAVGNGKNSIILNTTGGGLGGDCTINNNSLIYCNADTTSIVLNGNSSLTAVGCQIQNNPSLSNTTQNYILVNGNARCNLFACSLYNASNSASVKALIEIANTASVTSSSTINNCVLLFTNGVSTTTGAIINFSNTQSANTVNFYNNFCKCFVSINSPNNYIILKSSTGTVNFSQGNNLGSSTNHTIPNTGAFTGFTKTTFSAVV